jgi:hypothetical protein
MTRGPLLLLGLVPGSSNLPHGMLLHHRIPCDGGLDALAADAVTPDEQDPEAEAVRLAVLQASILSAYAATGDVLPVALGAAFSGDAALIAHLRSHAARIEAERTALSGSAEYVLAIKRRSSPPPAAGPAAGTGYLRRRQAERGDRRDLESDRRSLAARALHALQAAGAQLAPPHSPSPDALISVSALLRRSAVAEAAGALSALGSEATRLGLAMRMIGPCAPFSFVSPDRDHG